MGNRIVSEELINDSNRRKGGIPEYRIPSLTVSSCTSSSGSGSTSGCISSYVTGQGDDGGGVGGDDRCPAINPGTVLSPREIRAVKRSWHFIAGELKINGRDFFLKFFEFHPTYIDFFSSFRGKSIEELQTNKLVQAHGVSVMYLFTTLIENLGDPFCFAKFMTQSIKVHHKRGVDLAQYQTIFDVLIFYLEEKLADQFDRITLDAWHKFAVNFAYHVTSTNGKGYAPLTEVPDT